MHTGPKIISELQVNILEENGQERALVFHRLETNFIFRHNLRTMCSKTIVTIWILL